MARGSDTRVAAAMTDTLAGTATIGSTVVLVDTKSSLRARMRALLTLVGNAEAGATALAGGDPPEAARDDMSAGTPAPPLQEPLHGPGGVVARGDGVVFSLDKHQLALRRPADGAPALEVLPPWAAAKAFKSLEGNLVACLLLPLSARTNLDGGASSGKFRADALSVVLIVHVTTGALVGTGKAGYGDFDYVAGTTACEPLYDDCAAACAPGLHFYLTLTEALQHGGHQHGDHAAWLQHVTAEFEKEVASARYRSQPLPVSQALMMRTRAPAADEPLDECDSSEESDGEDGEDGEDADDGAEEPQAASRGRPSDLLEAGQAERDQQKLIELKVDQARLRVELALEELHGVERTCEASAEPARRRLEALLMSIGTRPVGDSWTTDQVAGLIAELRGAARCAERVRRQLLEARFGPDSVRVVESAVTFWNVFE